MKDSLDRLEDLKSSMKLVDGKSIQCGNQESFNNRLKEKVRKRKLDCQDLKRFPSIYADHVNSLRAFASGYDDETVEYTGEFFEDSPKNRWRLLCNREYFYYFRNAYLVEYESEQSCQSDDR